MVGVAMFHRIAINTLTLARYLSIAVIALGVVSTIGYSSHVRMLYQWNETSTALSLQASIGFVLTGTTLLLIIENVETIAEFIADKNTRK